MRYFMDDLKNVFTGDQVWYLIPEENRYDWDNFILGLDDGDWGMERLPSCVKEMKGATMWITFEKPIDLLEKV